MQRLTWLATLLLCACATQHVGTPTTPASAPPRADSEADFRAFLPRWEDAQTQFLNGDDTAWKQMCSQTDATTIFGAFGGYEKGWAEVGPRFDWAASQYKPSGAKKHVEYLTIAVAGDLAFTVSIEHDEVSYTGDTAGARPQARGLRVTQTFRREAGAWKLVHRHADPLVEKQAPGGPRK